MAPAAVHVPQAERTRQGVNIALGIVAAVLLVFFILAILGAVEAQENLAEWEDRYARLLDDPLVGPQIAGSGPKPEVFSGIALISFLGFVACLATLIVRLVKSDRQT